MNDSSGDDQHGLPRRAAEPKAIPEHAVDVIITIGQQGRIENVNRSVEKVFGFSREEVLGQNIKILMPPQPRQEHDSQLSSYLRGLNEAIAAEMEYRVVFRNYRKDGTVFWNDLQVSPVYDAHGRVTHFVGILTDVTERQRKHEALQETIDDMSQQLRAAESELIEQARLATLGQAFGGIAHEIRNPLNALRTSAYYLLNARQPTPKKMEEHLKRIDRQVAVIDNVVTTLFDMACLPEPELDPSALSEWIPDALREVSLSRFIDVMVDLPSELPCVLVDVNQVSIALKNLIRNARDSMTEGGTITISAEAENDLVRMMVTDTGEGISADSLPKIMEPLYSTKPRGMGLGLAISRAIIENNKGTIEVESTLGEGTTFTVRFKSARSTKS